MKNIFANIFLSPFMLSINSSDAVADSGFNVSSVYLVTTILSLMLLFGYYIFVKNKNKWLYLMFSSVCVVNAGYFLLSVSKTLDMVLWGNRISYLGSVFLPLSMLFVILDLCNINYKKLLPYTLLAISCVMFLITATPGICGIYYKEATLEIIGGTSVLNKVYGPLHPLYMVYLGIYYASMVWILFSSGKKAKSNKNILIIVVAVTVNLFVWLLEQLVEVDFEILSVSYIISEFFLLSVFLMLEEQERIRLSASPEPEIKITANESANKNESGENEATSDNTEFLRHFSSQLSTLTPTEKIVYGLYVSGKSTKEVLSELNITENTLKYHNKNIYSKLGVSSRKVLIETAKQIEAE